MVIEPKLTTVYTSGYETAFTVYAQFEPETEYRVTIGAAARDFIGVSLGRDVTTTFRVGPREPSIGLIGAYRAGFYRAAGSIRVPIQWVNVPDVEWRVSRLAPEQATRLMISYEEWEKFAPADSDIVTRGTQALAGERNKGRVGNDRGRRARSGSLLPGVARVGQTVSIAR
jgi:uncharacterized protein YfaS (alpha-2-macroglobulin family)